MATGTDKHDHPISRNRICLAVLTICDNRYLIFIVKLIHLGIEHRKY